MIQTEPVQAEPTKIYRGTWDELMRRRDEFAPDAVLEMKVYAPPIDQENQELIGLLQAWRDEDATDDPQELEQRDAETKELLANLQASRLWMEGLLTQGIKVYVPEIADYEVRRELLRAGKPTSVLRLDRLKQFA